MEKPIAICIIDDDRVYQHILIRAIQNKGLCKEVLSFYEGKSAIEYLQENAKDAAKLPDMILLDMEMPIMDGWGFLEAYKNLAATLVRPNKLYVASASIESNEISNVKSNSLVADYLIKPVTPSLLENLVAEL